MTGLYVFGVMCLAAVVSAGSWNDSHICCASTVELKKSNSTYCCGNEQYDWTTHVCDPMEKLHPVEGKKTSCCTDPATGDVTMFDYNEHICCDGVLHPTATADSGEGEYEYRSCCGTDSYNYAKELCCANKIIPKEKNNECCGEVKYCTDDHVCISRFDGVEEEWTYKIEKLPDNHTDLCNVTLFDHETHACCWDKEKMQNSVVPKSSDLRDLRYPSCCSGKAGTFAYNSTTHACTESTGELVEIPEEYQNGSFWEVCNGEVFSWATHMCCKDHLETRDKDSLTQCCGSKVYNYTTHSCCNETVIEHSNETKMECCYSNNGQETFNTDTHSCCEGVKEGGKGKRCCYSSGPAAVFDPKSERCGRDGVIEIDDAENLDPLCYQDQNRYYK